jgi:hypothetical protein
MIVHINRILFSYSILKGSFSHKPRQKQGQQSETFHLHILVVEPQVSVSLLSGFFVSLLRN